MANGIENRTTREIARARIKEIYNDRATAEAQSYDSLLQEAEQYVRSKQPIPPGIFASLQPKHRKALTTPFADYDDVTALEQTYRTPGIITHDWLAQNKGKFTEGTWNSLMGKAGAASNAAARADADYITVRLDENGLKNLAFPKPKSKDEVDSLRLRLNIETTLKRMRERGPVDEDMMLKVVDQAIMNWGTIKYQGWFMDSVQVKKPTAAMTEVELSRLMTPEDDPSDYYGETSVRILDENGIARFVPSYTPVRLDKDTVVPVSYWDIKALKDRIGREPTVEEMQELGRKGLGQ